MIIGVLGNDSDPDDDTLTITEVANRSAWAAGDVQGTVALNRTARSASRRTPTPGEFRLHGERHHAGLGHSRRST